MGTGKMKKFACGLLFVGILLFCSPVFAAPFLVSDYYLASDAMGLPDYFSITYGGTTITGATTIQTNVGGDKRLYWDLGSLSPGTYDLSVKAVKVDPIWGTLESANVPFVLIKPASTLRVPVNINISR